MLAAAWASLIAVTASVSLPGTARADCLPSGPNDVTCAPPGTGGFTAGANGLHVTVQSGATASTTTPAAAAITINNTSTLENNGTISGEPDKIVKMRVE